MQEITGKFMRSPFDTEEKRAKRGERILWARQIVEPNRMEFARKLGIDVTTARDIESGKRNPGVELLYALCHSLRISLDYIVKGSLYGVDRELAAQLVMDHPELDPRRQPDNGHTETRGNTSSRTGAFYFHS
jgi:transcriptional regulator with XRE-family HTH domain